MHDEPFGLTDPAYRSGHRRNFADSGCYDGSVGLAHHGSPDERTATGHECTAAPRR